MAINSETQLVVGYYIDSGAFAHGFVYHYLHPLEASASGPSPDAELAVEYPEVVTIDASQETGSTYPLGVNSSGVISGWWQGGPLHHYGFDFGFIATPLK